MIHPLPQVELRKNHDAHRVAVACADSLVITDKPFRDERGLLAANSLAGDRPCYLYPSRHVFDRLQCEPRSHAGACGNRRYKAKAVQSVVDPHLEIALD